MMTYVKKDKSIFIRVMILLKDKYGTQKTELLRTSVQPVSIQILADPNNAKWLILDHFSNIMGHRHIIVYN